jgi:nucleotide-binding universal stress UspA family protein
VTNQMHKLTIRRILVALDASTHSLAALEAAANMALLLKAELVGLFVEDINLLRAAGLPFVQEIRYALGERRAIDVPRMEAYLRAQAAQAQRDLSEMAERRHLRYSFRVARGPVSAELLAAALEADLLALGRLGRSLAQSELLGSTARTAVAHAKGPVLLMRAGVDLSQPVLVIYDGCPAAQRALWVGATLAQPNGSLHVLVWADDNETAKQFKSDIVMQLADIEVAISYRRLHDIEPDKLVETISHSNTGLLVIGTTASPLPPQTLQTVLERLDTPVLVVR